MTEEKHSELKRHCKIIANEGFLIRCKIQKEKHDSGYHCIVCEGSADGKSVFRSKECVDDIGAEIPIRIDAPTEDVFQMWRDNLEFPVVIDGCYSSMRIKQKS